MVPVLDGEDRRIFRERECGLVLEFVPVAGLEGRGRVLCSYADMGIPGSFRSLFHGPLV